MKDTLDQQNEDEEVYSHEGREKLVDQDEISPWEAAFMEGAEGDGQNAKCRNCGKVLMREATIVERAIDGELFRFCSEECLEKFQKKNR